MWYRIDLLEEWLVEMRVASKRIAWLCLLLMLSSAIAFVAHHHSDGNETTQCMVCIAAHSAAPTSPVVSAVVTFVALTTLRAKSIESPSQLLLAFALSVRPPPEF
jgi:hypothetical protein